MGLFVRSWMGMLCSMDLFVNNWVGDVVHDGSVCKQLGGIDLFGSCCHVLGADIVCCFIVICTHVLLCFIFTGPCDFKNGPELKMPIFRYFNCY